MLQTASRPFAVATALAAALVLVACTDHPTAPTATENAQTPVLAASSGGGAQVVRTDFPFGFIGGGDPRDNLAFFVGPLDPVAAVALKCPDPSAIAPISPGARAQIVNAPSGHVQVGALTRDAHIAIWQFTGPVDYCALIGAPVVATGVVQYKVEITNEGAGAFTLVEHAIAQGTVDLTSGGQASVRATARILIQHDGTPLFDEERVSLTPF